MAHWCDQELGASPASLAGGLGVGGARGRRRRRLGRGSGGIAPWSQGPDGRRLPETAGPLAGASGATRATAGSDATDRRGQRLCRVGAERSALRLSECGRARAIPVWLPVRRGSSACQRRAPPAAAPVRREAAWRCEHPCGEAVRPARGAEVEEPGRRRALPACLGAVRDRHKDADPGAGGRGSASMQIDRAVQRGRRGPPNAQHGSDDVRASRGEVPVRCRHRPRGNRSRCPQRIGGTMPSRRISWAARDAPHARSPCRRPPGSISARLRDDAPPTECQEVVVSAGIAQEHRRGSRRRVWRAGSPRYSMTMRATCTGNVLLYGRDVAPPRGATASSTARLRTTRRAGWARPRTSRAGSPPGSPRLVTSLSEAPHLQGFRRWTCRRSTCRRLAGKPPLLIRAPFGLRSPRVCLRSIGRLIFDAGTVPESRFVDCVSAPVVAPLVLARADCKHDAGFGSSADDDVLRAGWAVNKSHRRNGRSSPSTMRSASPDSTTKSSWSASRWYIPVVPPGESTRRKMPICSNSVSPSNSEHADRSSRTHRAARAFRTNQPSRVGASPYSVLLERRLGTTGRS